MAKPKRRPSRKSRKSSKTRKAVSPWRRRFAWAAAALVVLGVAYVAYLDHVVRGQFEAKRWALPARVYARPLELFSGESLGADQLRYELTALKYRSTDQAERPGTYVFSGGSAYVTTRGFDFPDGPEPGRALKVDFDGSKVSSVTDRTTGRKVDVVRLDPVQIGSLYPSQHEDRVLLRLGEVPQPLVQALLAVEDRGFYHHFGISPTGILRAAIANIRAGHVVQGGSTITQQLVKNFFLTDERSLVRKFNEAIMAVLLEMHYSKDAILETYVNEVYLGQDGSRAIHGFGLASRFYFDKPLSALREDQLALLAGLVKGPSFYNPRRHPRRALDRRNLVLDAMVDNGVLSRKRADDDEAQPLGVVAEGRTAQREYPAYLDLVRRHLQRDYKEDDLTTEGLRIFTGFSPLVQHAAEQSVTQMLDRLGNNKLEAAMVVVNPSTGEVEAVVGGRDPRFAGFNRALDIRRPIGSLVKPAIYLSALSQPERYGLGTPLDDDPVRLRDPDTGKEWAPSNYDDSFRGDVLLVDALAHSYNVPTVRLGLDVGLRTVTNTFDRLGGTLPGHIYPSFLLGAVPEAPIEIAQMYQTLASGGFQMPLRAVRAVTTQQGEPLQHYSLGVHRVFDADSVYLTNYALEQAMSEGTGRGVYRKVSKDVHIAGKTGTTDDLRDSWFAGFTDNYLAVVWVGRDDNASVGLTGATGALRIWLDAFLRVQPGSLTLSRPDDVDLVWVDGKNGKLAKQYCERARQLPYVHGHAPQEHADCFPSGPEGVVQGVSRWFKGIFN